MGNIIYGVDIAGIIAREIGANCLDATLIVVTNGTRTPGDPTAGVNPTEQNYPCKALLEDYDTTVIKETNVQKGDRLAIIFGDTIESNQVPKINDKFTIESKTYFIKDVKRDSAAATYECQIRL
jgi:hypothetical protein